jgi:hypothetical protein
MDQPIINALIATFLALGEAAGGGALQRAGDLIRDLIADGVVDRDTRAILESLLAATGRPDEALPPGGWLADALTVH